MLCVTGTVLGKEGQPTAKLYFHGDWRGHSEVPCTETKGNRNEKEEPYAPSLERESKAT